MTSDAGLRTVGPNERSGSRRLDAEDLRSHATAMRDRGTWLHLTSTEEVVEEEEESRLAPDPDAERVAASLELIADIIDSAGGALEVVSVERPRELRLTHDESDQALAPTVEIRARPTDDRRIDAVVDQHAMRRLARYWELGARTVHSRTVVRLDGDARTQFPPSSIDTEGADRVHAAIALMAMSLWPTLLQAAGAVVTAVAALGSRAWRASPIVEREAVRGRPSAGEVDPLSLPELLDAGWRFFGLGRIVFESPTSGPTAALRTMIHPSGDVETSIRLADLDGELVELHSQTVQLWVQRLTVTLDRLRSKVLDRIVLLTSATTTVGAAGAFTQGRPSLALTLGLGGPVLGLAGRSIGRRYLRRKLVSILQNRTDRIESPAPHL